jgi:hypothetical protein
MSLKNQPDDLAIFPAKKTALPFFAAFFENFRKKSQCILKNQFVGVIQHCGPPVAVVQLYEASLIAP